MPAVFAHMIAADKAKSTLEAKDLSLPTLVLNRFPQWLQAGAVGPDYPYLHHLTSHDKSDSWADLLHYSNTGEVVRAGVKILQRRYPIEKDTKEFQRALAWLYGYTSHVVLDASIHPVVRAIVGEYKDNPTEHRACEMYMDSFIFKETYGIELDNSEWADYLRALTDHNTGEMDDAVVSLWSEMLEQVYPEVSKNTPPQISSWHKAYLKKIDAADFNIGYGLFRHAASEHGVLYARRDEIKPEDMKKYIEEAKLPDNNMFNNRTWHYKDIFQFGVDNVSKFWISMTSDILEPHEMVLAFLPNWDLDKGTIDLEGKGDATLWVA